MTSSESSTQSSTPGDLLILTPDDLRSRRDSPFADLPSRLVVLGSGKVAVSLAGAAAALGHDVALVASDTVLAPSWERPGASASSTTSSTPV